MPGVSLFTWNGLVPERLSSRGLALLGSRWRGWGDGVHERVWARAEGLPLPRGWESPLWMGLRVWVCLSFPVSVPWPHRWPRVSGAAWRRLAERPQPAEQGDDLRSPSGGREERVQVHAPTPSGRSGSRKGPKRPEASGEEMGKQSLWVAVLWEASCYLAEGPAGMRRGCVRPRHHARPQRSLGLHVRCEEYAGEAPSANKGEAIHKAVSTATRPPNQSQRNFSTSIALVPKWRYVTPRSFLKAKVLPALRKDPSLPYIVIARQLDFRLCPSCLAESARWAPDKRLWTPGDAAGLQSAWGGGEAVLPWPLSRLPHEPVTRWRGT